MARADLNIRRWGVPDGVARRGSIVVVHGLGEHSGRYAQLAGRLVMLGLEVSAYDHTGHGGSPGRRGAIDHPEALLDDLQGVFEAADARGRAAGDGAAPFLLGHSMGGTVAARAATGGRVLPRGLILSSPALRLHATGRAERALLALLRRVAPDLAVPNRLPADKLSHDAAQVTAYQRDAQVHDRITARLYDFLVDAGTAARRDAPRLTVPTLLVVAGADSLVDPRGAHEFAAALPDGLGTLHAYDALYHELFNEREPDRTRVLDDVAEWLELRLS